MITKDTIIKAAKAAGLDVREFPREHSASYDLHIVRNGKVCEEFEPESDDTDNAMIMDGAEVSLQYIYGVDSCWVHAEGGDAMRNVEIQGNNKAKARREAVILCAAAKWDAMQGEQK